MKTLALVFAALLSVSEAWAIPGNPIGEETITVSSSSIGLTTTVCKYQGKWTNALVQVKTNAIFFNFDAATPDTNDYNGAVGDFIEVDSASAPKFRMLRAGGSDAAVKVTCFLP